mmetsp:Transcript_43130/g.91946  ORF Transcript_43130/g.91946 Transcript_43130/m.91946 type:complete len:211 (+) Transcript_43130:48-680(+)
MAPGGQQNLPRQGLRAALSPRAPPAGPGPNAPALRPSLARRPSLLNQQRPGASSTPLSPPACWRGPPRATGAPPAPPPSIACRSALQLQPPRPALSSPRHLAVLPWRLRQLELPRRCCQLRRRNQERASQCQTPPAPPPSAPAPRPGVQAWVASPREMQADPPRCLPAGPVHRTASTPPQAAPPAAPPAAGPQLAPQVSQPLIRCRQCRQ